MAYINQMEKRFERLGRQSELKDKYIELLKDVESCNHVYGEVVYDPEEIAFYDSVRDRWHVDCRKCGRRQYTYNKELYMKRK